MNPLCTYTLQAHDAEVRACAVFLTAVTLDSIKGVFSEAKGIMDWLTCLAKLVAQAGQPMAWVTPLGLPVVQPYRCSHNLCYHIIM